MSLRKQLDEEREKVTLLWVPGHIRVPGNEIAHKEAILWKTTPLSQKNTHHTIVLTGSKQ
jgi:ribonuclease HI